MATKKNASTKPRGGSDPEGKDPIVFLKAWRPTAPPSLLELSETVLLELRGNSTPFRGHSLCVTVRYHPGRLLSYHHSKDLRSSSL